VKWRLIQFSAVVVGQSHNPTILNPDFLREQGIVPKSWGWEVAKTITTPPLAVVAYTNGVSINVEQNKLQVTDPNVEEGPDKSRVTEIASAYVTVLPHVRYTAVGNNFQSLHPMEDAAERMKSRFLKEGPWTTSPRTLETAGLKLTYEFEDQGRLTLALEAGEAKLPDAADQQPVVLANANFDRKCGERATHTMVVGHLEKAMQDWAIYEHTMNEILAAENNS
jgi:hypothetical protein